MDYGENRPQNTFIDNIMNDITQSANKPISKIPSLESPEPAATSFFGWIQNISWITWLIVFLVLAFLGFNIFVYLAKGTQDITNIFAPLIKMIFGTTVEVAGEAIDVSAQGAKVVVGATAGAIESGLTAIQDITPNGPPSSMKGQPISQQKQQPDIMQQSSLNKALNTSQQQQQSQYDYQANEAPSSIHGSGQAGWCYVGEDRGYRTCAQVGVNDTCMSGDIFPSQEICINPNLRP
jgi:hypothetical protein